MGATTPASITEIVTSFCKEIDAASTPVFVAIQDTEGCYASDCFGNVHRRVQSRGGLIQHGWIIWLDPNKLIEAEFHAVWTDPDGRFIDITPNRDGESTILFLPDSTLTYKGRPRDNIRKALTNDPSVLRLIQKHKELFDLRLKYDKKGVAEIPYAEVLRIEEKYEPRTLQGKNQIRIGRNDLCPCASGRKFKRCHGQA